MKDCLSEQALLDQYLGEGSKSAGGHLKSCAVCAKRYRRLRQDMEAISTAIRMPHRRSARGSRFGNRIVALAMAGGVAVLVVAWLTWHQTQVSGPGDISGSGAALVDRQVSAEGSLQIASNSSVPVSYVSYLRTAFNGEDGCGQGDSVFNLSCSQNWQAER